MFGYAELMFPPGWGKLSRWEWCWHMPSMFLGMEGVLVFAVSDAMCDLIFQEERYEEEEDDEDGVEERILGSNFSPGRNVEVFELPDSEALFLPTNMDTSQMAFKFKEVQSDAHTDCLFMGFIFPYT